MKKTNILKASLMMGVVIAATSCKEETINFLDASALPQASDYAIKAEVDQELNKVTLTLTDKNGNPAVGVYPIWKVYTKSSPLPSTRPVYTDIVTIAGDYDVEAQVGNHNGVSDGVIPGSFHIENTMVDFSPYILFLTNNDSKVWQIAGNEQGHLGCGESGTDGLNWWSANPYDKADWGVYDNRMTFADNGGNSTGLYTYDPGASGTIYINKEITDLPPYSDYNTNDDNDYIAPAEVQADRTFTLSPEGTDLFLVLPAGTLMGYLPNMDLWNNPKWKVLDMNKNKVELVCDNGGIAWHYILQPEGADAGDKPFEGFKYDSEFNLWRDADVHLNSTWFADGSWGELGNQPEVSVTNESIKLHTPAEMGGDKWQGQVHIGTDIVLSAASTYDFSIKITSNVDSKVTVKPHLDGDDGVFFTEDQIAFDAGGSYFYLSDVPGWDGPLVLTLDFAGYPDTDFEVSKVVVKDHANDDGTVLPSETPDVPAGDVVWVDANSDTNVWNSGNITNITFYTAMGGDWSPVTNPDLEEGDNKYELTYPDGSGDQQWQAQFALETDLTFPDPDKLYDFRVTINPTWDVKATVKPTDFTDGSFWGADQHSLTAYEDNVVKYVGKAAEMPDFKIVFDFPGAPAGGKVTISNIIIQEHSDAPAGGGSGSTNWVDANSADNLFNADSIVSWEAWTANDSWSQIASPEMTQNGNHWELAYSETPGSSQWQAQFQFVTDLVFDGDKVYDFKVTINPTRNIAGATIKPCDAVDEDNIYWDTLRADLEAYEDNVITIVGAQGALNPFKMAFDFAGVQAGDKIVIKDIVIQEHN